MSDGTWTEGLGKKIHIDTDNIMVITREKGGWKQAEEGKRRKMVIKGYLILGGEYIIQYTDDILQNHIIEICIIS